MNVHKPKATVRKEVAAKRKDKLTDRHELTRLRRELRDVKQERDCYKHALLRQMQAETAAMNLDLRALYDEHFKGRENEPEFDLIGWLKSKYKLES